MTLLELVEHVININKDLPENVSTNFSFHSSGSIEFYMYHKILEIISPGNVYCLNADVAKEKIDAIVEGFPKYCANVAAEKLEDADKKMEKLRNIARS
jgi:hypothetical protein